MIKQINCLLSKYFQSIVNTTEVANNLKFKQNGMAEFNYFLLID